MKREMLSGRLKARVVAATVRLTKEGGRGVFVPGGYILTAAHCIHRWSGPAGTAQKDYKLESVKTRDGRELTARVLALDPVVDIAALGPVPYIGALDDRALPEEGIAFAQFGLDSVPLGRKSTLSDKPFPVYIFTHKGNWLTGSATAGSYDGTLFVSTDEGIVGGTSGSPVVDKGGRLVGVVSSGSLKRTTLGYYSVTMPVPCQALPRWLVGSIMEAQARCSKRSRQAQRQVTAW